MVVYINGWCIKLYERKFGCCSVIHPCELTCSPTSQSNVLILNILCYNHIANGSSLHTNTLTDHYYRH